MVNSANICRRIGLSVTLLMLVQISFANYLRISSLAQDQANGTVSFDLAWDNSWRIDSIGNPSHWDAAWVFVKFRPCNAPANTPWTHALINTALNAHTFGNLEPTLSDGSAIGIDPGPNNTGLMMRHSSNGVFPNAGNTSLTIALANFPATGDYEVKVFGIEMVFVPEGSFMAGGTTETYAYQLNGGPFLIDSEAGLTGLTYTNNSVIPAAYPKGFEAFYCMKYEISQGQYAAFLNTIDGVSQLARFPGSFNSYRQRINSGGTPPDIYFSDRPDRASNYLSWQDLLAYLDWAALRPMTEFEFEKACRGQGPYAGGYAWGTQNFNQITALGTPEDGTELSQTADANAALIFTLYTGGDGGYGPVRVGIFATATTTTREETGATYYGIMEMTGNVYEQVVGVYNDVEYLAYDRIWGDGNITAAGDANVATWPYTTCVGTCYRALRGGSYSSGITYGYTSARYQYGYWGNLNRYAYTGGRGVR